MTLNPAIMPSISVVVPVYNGELLLRELVSRIESSLAATGARWELLLVNDGSADGSWKAICESARGRSQVRGLDLMRNYGQHNALLAGIRECRHEVVVTLDDDLQNPPEEIPKLLSKLGEGHDIVYGVPRETRHGPWRKLSSWLTKIVLTYCMGIRHIRETNSFRAFRTQLRDAFQDYRGPYVDMDALLSWGSHKFATVEVRHDERRAGTSNYTFGKLVLHTLTLLTNFSVAPLRLASYIGFALVLFGMLILVYVVGRYLIQDSIPGFPFLASVIALFSGAQLFALGIIGEYLAPMHFRLMGQPSSVVRDRTAGADANGS